jgi:AraC family transcriptional regulator
MENLLEEHGLRTPRSQGGLYAAGGARILAKIAIAVLGKGEGWRVADVICGSGPEDRPFEERHGQVSIAIVAAGTFQYRSTSRRELMTPGSFLLGSPGQSFECAHEHGTGDRCLSFHYEPELFASITGAAPRFRAQRLPPLRSSAALTARACSALAAPGSVAWDELAIEVAARTAQLANDIACDTAAVSSKAEARVTRLIRAIERHPDAALPLTRLAKSAGLSPYHFLRTFTRITGATPHQFALRARLRKAAMCLATNDQRVLDIALDCGFGDLSNFNRTFRAEFGVTPRAYRQNAR